MLIISTLICKVACFRNQLLKAMFVQIKKISFLLSFLCLGLNGCLSSIDVNGDLDELGAERIVCLVDGKPFEAVNGKGLLAVDFVMTELVEGNDNFLLTIYSVELLEEGGALAVGFKLAGKKITDLKAGDTFTTWTAIDTANEVYSGAMGGVEQRTSLQTDEHIFKASSNHTQEMNLTITEIDHVAKQVSGTFRFVALDDENNTKVEVTEGEFLNISWAE